MLAYAAINSQSNACVGRKCSIVRQNTRVAEADPGAIPPNRLAAISLICNASITPTNSGSPAGKLASALTA